MPTSQEKKLSIISGDKWQLPDDVVFVDELPHTATGKILKIKLRGEYKDYKLPTVAE
jgi:fatty-acyl-CoA synthase